MSGPRLEKEMPTHYVVHDGTSPFRVLKDGLSESMHAKIRALGGQKMAGGGMAGGGAGGGPGTGATGGPGEGLPPVDPNAGATPTPQQIAQEVANNPTLAARIFGGQETPLAVGEGASQGVAGPDIGQPVGGGPGSDEVAGVSRVTSEPAPVSSSSGSSFPSNAAPAAGSQAGVPEMQAEKARRAFAAQFTREPGAAPAPPAPPAPAAPVGPAMPYDRSVAEMAGATREGVAAEQQKGAAAAELATQQAAAIGEAQKGLEAQVLEQKAMNARAVMETDAAMSALQAARDEAAKVDTTIDPGRYWSSRSTPGRIAGAIGLVLGAIGAGNDGVNRAAGMISQAIDRDLDAQKTEHELKLRKGAAGIDAARSIYALTRDKFSDEAARMAAAKGSALELADLQLKRIAATTANPMAKASANALSAELKKQQAMFDGQAYGRALEATKLGILQMTAAAKAGKTTQASANATTAQRSLDEAMDIIRRKGTFEMTGDEQGRLNKVLGDYAYALARVKNPTGQVTLDEKNLMLDMLGVRAGQLSVSNDTALRLLSKARRDVELEAARAPAPGRHNTDDDQ